jgi:carbonic anhydrase/acetyltransferase-like protein (isoleucine patch superfamily)
LLAHVAFNVSALPVDAVELLCQLIGARSIVAAGALVTKGMNVPEGSLVLGCPAKVVRALTPEEQHANQRLALKYVESSRRFLAMGYGVALA